MKHITWSVIFWNTLVHIYFDFWNLQCFYSDHLLSLHSLNTLCVCMCVWLIYANNIRDRFMWLQVRWAVIDEKKPARKKSFWVRGTESERRERWSQYSVEAKGMHSVWVRKEWKRGWKIGRNHVIWGDSDLGEEFRFHSKCNGKQSKYFRLIQDKVLFMWLLLLKKGSL